VLAQLSFRSWDLAETPGATLSNWSKEGKGKRMMLVSIAEYSRCRFNFYLKVTSVHSFLHNCLLETTDTEMAEKKLNDAELLSESLERNEKSENRGAKHEPPSP